MGYGIINTGGTTKQRALSGMRQSADSEQQRNIANKNIEAADDAAKKTNAGAGLSTGAVIGANMASGVAGASVGLSALATGGIGLGAALLLSELF